jgi:hypothetical protein
MTVLGSITCQGESNRAEGLDTGGVWYGHATVHHDGALWFRARAGAVRVLLLLMI